MNDGLWKILALALLCAGCAADGSAVSGQDSACRQTAERWEKVPTGRAHALIEHYYEVDASATKAEIFRLCKEHEREAMEDLKR